MNTIGDRLKELDNKAHSKMTDTPWLNALIANGGIHLGQKGNKKDESMKIQKVGGIWHGIAINQNQSTSGTAHRDLRDTKDGFNCVIPYGDWEGGDLLLWEIRQRLQFRQGHALFFRSRVLTHNACGISGLRNCVDLFTHENMLQLDKENRKHGRTEKEAQEIKKKKKKKKNKKRNAS